MEKQVSYRIKTENNMPGVFRETLESHRIGGVEKILEVFAQNAGIVINDFDRIEETQPIKINVKKSHVTMSAKIVKLSLKTTYSIAGDYVVPEYAEDKSFIDLDIKWLPTFNVFFFVKAIPGPWKIDRAGLFAVLPGQTGTWQLPLPNQFGDGCICLGDNLFAIRGSLQQVFKKAYDLLQSSIWNADQLPNMAKDKAIFRFHPTTFKWVPESQNYPAWCNRVSNALIEEALQS